MSVQSNTYILAGISLPRERFLELAFPDLRESDDLYEALEQYTDSAYQGIQHHNGLCVLMGEGRVAVGRVLAKSDDQNGNYGFNKPVDVTTAMTPELHAEVTRLLGEHIGIQHAQVHLWVLTHYR